MNMVIHRKVRKLEPHDEQSYGDSIGPFSQYLAIPNIILLGDPGSGKTHTFKAAARIEKAKFLSIRQFHAMEGMDCKGKILYLDGLDEFRSRVDDKNVINEIIQLLCRLGQPCIRLSCRVADWLGKTDLSLFQGYFGNSQYVVLNLEPLNEEEVATILHEKGIENSEEFVREAQRHRLEGLLGNPQTLIMLSDVVRHGMWPKTKRELYERASQILLSEPNLERMRNGLGQYRPEDLMAPAGAACASILVSGVAGISLLGNQLSSDFPTYRDVPFDDRARVQACLMRRAFSVVNVQQEAVSYIHRTIAEFLAAQWLADQVREGLPVRRVQNLIGIEGHPAPELRGLHAWLASLLPEHAMLLINSDPFGVLMYGDPASLSPSGRKSLLYAVETLSTTDPWFRSGDWSDRPLGALSGPDMVEAFQRILGDSQSGFHLRSVVLDAICNGPSLPQMQDDIRRILADSKAIYQERLKAVDALLSVIPDGEQAVIEVYRQRLFNDLLALPLRAEIITRLYSKGCFDQADVVSLFKDLLRDNEEHNYIIGGFWGLTACLPEEDLPDILDNLCEIKRGEDFDGSMRISFEFKSAFSLMLARALNSDFPKQPEQIWHWLKALYHFGRDASGGKDDIRDWLSKNQSIVVHMFWIVYEKSKEEEKWWKFIYEFQRVTLHSLPDEVLAMHIFEKLKTKYVFMKEDFHLYRMCGILIFSTEFPPRDCFEKFFVFANNNIQLQEARDQVCQCEIEDWKREDIERTIHFKQQREIVREKNRSNLEQTKESIRAGIHLHNLGFLARIYFGIFSDIDQNLPPIERLCTVIGDELIIDALEGFSAVIRRSDLPSPIEVASIDAKGRYSPWWYAILAGMDEAWQEKLVLDIFPDGLLKTALAISYVLSTFENYEEDGRKERRKKTREWKERLFTERSDIVQSVFEDFIRVGLRAKRRYINVLYDLAHKKQTEPWRSKCALKFLTEFPYVIPEHLRYLTLATMFDSECHNDMIELAKDKINTRGRVKGEQRAIWLAVGFLLDFKAFQTSLMRYARSREQAIWILKEIIQQARVRESDKAVTLSIEQLEFVIKLVGEKFKNVSHPTGGWSGDQNPWDASEFVRHSINQLSAIPEASASDALRRLLTNDSMKSYHDHLRHALAGQVAIGRQAKYRQPSWPEATEALKGGRPANIADLHALVLDHIGALKGEIRLSNTDTYKAFWRCNSKGAVDRPEIEDICRDRLIDLLRPRLVLLGIRIEPEGHMAKDKKADIVIMPPPGQKLPLELKRDTHEDLWEAWRNQLERLYARDPEAEGYGIYGVFWFGDKRSGRVPAPPTGIPRPISAEDLEAAIRLLIPSNRRHYLEAIVFDVTPPE
jgi:hypothetical protein